MSSPPLSIPPLPFPAIALLLCEHTKPSPRLQHRGRLLPPRKLPGGQLRRRTDPLLDGRPVRLPERLRRVPGQVRPMLQRLRLLRQRHRLLLRRLPERALQHHQQHVQRGPDPDPRQRQPGRHLRLRREPCLHRLLATAARRPGTAGSTSITALISWAREFPLPDALTFDLSVVCSLTGLSGR